MSRGPGLLQRALLRRLQESPARRLSRLDSAEIFVKQEGHTCSNLLRSIRGLERVHRVHLHDSPDLAKAYVSLAQPGAYFSEATISEILREIGKRP